MNVTHYLEIHNVEHECDDMRCLTDKNSAIRIIFALLQRREKEKFFITFNNLMTGKEEKLTGLYNSGAMYSASPIEEQKG